MARRNPAQLQFDALSLEGALLPPEWLARVAALEAPAQSPADYGVPKGLQLRDEIGRYWRIAEAIWAEFAAARGGADPVGAAGRLARDLLVQVFGFSDLAIVGERTMGGRVFPLAYEALGGRVPVVVGSPSEGMDQSVLRHGDGARRRSAWGGLQEYLNAADEALWGIATNGNALRVGRDNASLTRPAWLEADLERIFIEERFADFSVLWLLLHVSRFGRADQPVHEAPLEKWRDAGREEGSRAREALRVGVEDALRALGQGFVAHPANTVLRDALASGALSPGDYFNELLRLVYRMIFLLTVEERGILHPEAPKHAEARRRHDNAVLLYADGYGMRRLRERSVRHAAHDRHGDLWASIRPVFAALARADGEQTLALPGLGGLFAADQCSHLDASALENRSLLTAIFRLAWLREGDALARVNWKDMGVEEFGSVYESLLELVPVVSDGGRRFGFAGEGESAGNARKLTGSYYTPDALVQQLLDTALEPVVAQRLAEHPAPADAERALLSLAVVDPACGSGHFLLAAARRLAGHLARLRAGGTPGAAEYRHALRDVVTHCIHGVDRNPMALELARMALWLEAYTPDRALGFLDHHLVCGDALLGLLDLSAVKGGIPDEAFKALTGDDKNVAKMLTKLNRAGRKALEAQQKRGQLVLSLGTQPLADAFAQLDALSDDRIEGVEAKRSRYAALREQAATSPLALAADLFVGAFLIPRQLVTGERALTENNASERFPTTATLGMALDGTLATTHRVAVIAQSTCAKARVLHWPLAFPQVFARGGFDVVLGNPPWERVKIQDAEWFGSRRPEIANAANAAQRHHLIEALVTGDESDLRLAMEYEFAKRQAEGESHFARTSGRFPLGSRGDVNTYLLFAELAADAVSSTGRMGLVLPLGIATDEVARLLFSKLVESERIDSVYGLINERLLFPSVLHNFKFCLFTATGGEKRIARPVYAFNCYDVAALKDPERVFSLSADQIARLNPDTKTAPTFFSRRNAEVTLGIYERLPLIGAGRDVTGWHVEPYSMLHMGTASEHFVLQRGTDDLPVYEAKMIHQYNHRYASYDASNPGARTHMLPTSSERQLQDPQYSVASCYFISSRHVLERVAGKVQGEWLLGMRRIASAGLSRTSVAAILPLVGVSDSMTLLDTAKGTPLDALLLLSILNSVAFDFVVRQKVAGSNISFYILRQLPIPVRSSFRVASPDSGVPLDSWIAERALELTFTSCDLSPFSKAAGGPSVPFAFDPIRRAQLMAEIDAAVLSAFGITRDEASYILETFEVLRSAEIQQEGRYATRERILFAFDALATKLNWAGADVRDRSVSTSTNVQRPS